MDPRIPDKHYFRIGEVAELAGVETPTLRFWESAFAALRPEKGSSGRRSYSRKDVELVLRIRDLLYDEGFTIAGAQRRLSSRDTAAPMRRALERARNEAEQLLRLVEE